MPLLGGAGLVAGVSAAADAERISSYWVSAVLADDGLHVTEVIDYDFVFRRIDVGSQDGDTPAEPPVAHGAFTVVCVERGAGETALRSVAMPRDVDEKIEVAPSEILSAAKEHPHVE